MYNMGNSTKERRRRLRQSTDVHRGGNEHTQQTRNDKLRRDSNVLSELRLWHSIQHSHRSGFAFS